jgi:nitrate reductase gamma subunit
MGYLPYVIAYGALAVFLIACVARMLKWSRMPMHLRWELYPVAHEGGGRAAYGGSYLEETDWWTKPREVSMLGELKVMVPRFSSWWP